MRRRDRCASDRGDCACGRYWDCGPRPKDLQNTCVFSAAIMNGSKNITASKAMIDFLRTSEATGEGKRHGVRL